ncbi:MAG TPA: hypothetical protein VGI14_08380 [Casimicrobiaceae bacterium]|jgi:hypothetical protein
MDMNRGTRAEVALLRMLLECIERQQSVQMGTLEIVARLGEIAAETQRRLADLLGAREPPGGASCVRAERHVEGDTVRGNATARRKQMMG